MRREGEVVVTAGEDPETSGGDLWQTLIDTAEPDRPMAVRVRLQRESYPLYGRSLALLRTVRPDEAEHDLTSTQVEAMRTAGAVPVRPVP